MALPIPLKPDEAPIIHESLRLCYEQDRAFNGYPHCTVYRQSYTGEDPLHGTYNESLAALHTSVECDFEPFADLQIANSAGAIQPEDRLVITYSIPELSDVKTIIFELDNRKWNIISQHFEHFSNRNEFQLRPLQKVT